MFKYVLIGCGARKSCAGDKAAPTCDTTLGRCICGRNDRNSNGVFNDANIDLMVDTCRLAATRQTAPTCSNLGQTDNPANFQCVCGSKGISSYNNPTTHIIVLIEGTIRHNIYVL